MNKLLEKLNTNQKEAVLHTEGPLLILAGAGSGKTRVITHRIAYLIKEKGIAPYNIMAVTFTNKAAAEMKKRVIDLVGPEGNSVFIKTFHSASVYILRRFGEKLGIPRVFSIYDTSDQETLIKDILVNMKLDPKKIKPKMIASRISQIKEDSRFFSSGPDELMPRNLPFDFPEIYRVYHKRLKDVGALDFNDLLIETTRLLRSHPDELSKMHRMWKYFMVDEYQDTNHAQYLICKYLASETRNLCVVGDDDQSIYSWRGADIRNILDFEKDYTEAKIITLEENYRSTLPILESASYVIDNNRQRKSKELLAVRGEGEPVVWCQANYERGEARYVVDMIISLKNREGLKNKDFAVFYRTNAQSRVFEEFLRMENLPYRVVGGLKFYDRKEIKDIMAYLRLISNPADLVSLLRVINTPTRGIGIATVNSLRETARENAISVWEVIEKEYPVKGRIPKGLSEFRDIILKGMQMDGDIPEHLKLTDLVNEIIDISGLRGSLEDEDSIENRARIENINEFINSIYDYEAVNSRTTLDEFLQNVSLLTSEENPAAVDELGAITLMTVHIAKGLEFPVVFLTGMEEGTFPHINSIDTAEGLEEERRLCYVGITRAMDRLFITNARQRRSYGDIIERRPSRFISEIPAELLQVVEYFDNDSQIPEFSSHYHRGISFSRPETKSYSNKISTDPDYETNHSGSRFSLMDNVIHLKYGTGTVTDIKGTGDNIKLTVRFKGGKNKFFIEKYASLQKVN